MRSIASAAGRCVARTARRARTGGGLALAAASFLGHAALAQDATAEPPFDWQSIDYPRLPVPGAPGESFGVQVNTAQRVNASQRELLRLDLLVTPSAVPAPLADPSRIRVRFHAGNAAPVDGAPPGEWAGTHWTYFVMYTFRWTERPFDEAWFEIGIGDRTFWMEVPYGFAGNPNAAAIGGPTGPPRLAPAMAHLGTDDVLVPWAAINYSSIGIDHGWFLSFAVPNRAEPTIEVNLNRGDSTVPLESARIRLAIEPPNRRALTGRRIDGRESYFQERWDSFALPAESGAGREWGVVWIEVDRASHAWRIPSSLFRAGHGQAVSGSP